MRGATRIAAGTAATGSGLRWVLARTTRTTRLLIVAALLALVVVVILGTARTEGGDVRPAPVPPALLTAVMEAATSCQTETGPRLAAQVMEASAFHTTASTPRGGQGLAGLTDTTWQQWAPWPDATRADPRANLLALAHDMCDLAGRVRALGVTGDGWQSALAAYVTGVDAVGAAHGIPEGAAAYVDEVSGYARWYESSDQFAGRAQSATPGATSSASAMPVPSATVTTHGPAATPTGSAPTGVGPTRTPSAKGGQPAPAPTTTSPPRDSLVGRASGRCLSSASGKDGTRLEIWDCDGTASQRWTVQGATLRSQGLCMDAAGAGTADGTPVQVAYCSGNPAQRFALRSDGSIYSAYAGKCLDVVDFGTSDGTKLQLWDCAGTSNQLWSQR